MPVMRSQAWVRFPPATRQEISDSLTMSGNPPSFHQADVHQAMDACLAPRQQKGSPVIGIRHVFRVLILAGGIAGLAAVVTTPPALAAPLPLGTFRLATSSPAFLGSCASSNNTRNVPYILDFCRAFDSSEQWVYGTQGFVQSLVNVYTGNCATATSQSEGALVVDMPCSSANVANQSWVTNQLGVIALVAPPQTPTLCWVPVNYKIQLAFCTVNVNQVWVATPV
jgi:hypothetical protein